MIILSWIDERFALKLMFGIFSINQNLLCVCKQKRSRETYLQAVVKCFHKSPKEFPWEIFEWKTLKMIEKFLIFLKALNNFFLNEDNALIRNEWLKEKYLQPFKMDLKWDWWMIWYEYLDGLNLKPQTMNMTPMKAVKSWRESFWKINLN